MTIFLNKRYRDTYIHTLEDNNVRGHFQSCKIYFGGDIDEPPPQQWGGFEYVTVEQPQQYCTLVIQYNHNEQPHRKTILMEDDLN